jgi:glycosyltransferase involved in cell wall biosynthesis
LGVDVLDHPVPHEMHREKRLSVATGKRARICFVAPSAFPILAKRDDIETIGGAELQQVIVAAGLVERGYDVSMVCLDFDQEDELEIDGIKVFKAFRPTAGIPVVRFLWPRLTSLWRGMKRADADIYYQRTAGMLTGVVAEFCRRHNRKSIFAAAGTPEFFRKTNRVPNARDRCIYAYGLRNVDRILVQNEEQAQLCRRNIGREPLYVPNCHPEPSRRSAARPSYALWVSTIRRLKQPALFLDLAAALPQHQFRMIGGPDARHPQLFESIRKRAAAMPNVEFLGFVPYSKVDEHFDGAMVFVNTSESEGFPNTFLQAWARGIPTVSFIDAGARKDGAKVGRQARSVEDMISTLDRLLTNEHQRSTEGALCRRYFEDHHSPTRVLDLYEQLFDELLHSERRA